MAGWGKLLLEMTLFAVVILVVYNVLKVYVLSKIHINKWIIFGIAIVVLIVPSLLRINTQNPIWLYGPSGIFIVMFLWFMDISGFNKRRERASTTSYSKRDNKKDVVIRPKAKPNRVKNKND